MTTIAKAPPATRLIVRLLLQIGEATYELGDAALEYEIPALRALLAPPVAPDAVSALPFALRERLATLCTRLGEAEPSYGQITLAQAEAMLTRLQAQEEDLLRTAEGASAEPSSSPIDKGLVRQLKERWRTRFGTPGPVEEIRRAWEGFKQGVCGETVADRAMRADQYEKLLAALTSSRERTCV